MQRQSSAPMARSDVSSPRSPRAASRHRARQLRRAARRFAAPERNGGRGAVRVFHAHASGLDAADPPRRRAQQEHVAGQALDREVFVERADDGLVGLGEHQVLRVVGNRAARGDRRQPRAAPAAHDAVHPVAMEERAAAPALGADAFRQHLDDRVEVLPRQVAVQIRAAHELEEIVFAPVLRRRHRHDLLRENVERRRGNSAADRARPARIERTSAAHSISSSRVVAKMPPFGLWCARPDGPIGRCAAARRRSTAASRSGRPDRRCRCRCPARATPWRRPPSASRSSAALPPSAAACATGCRDARAPHLRRAARPDGARPARPGAAC